MGDKEDYLTSYRVFFENFAATVNPEDQLPVNIAGYTITESELPGEVLYWTTQYLAEKQCPPTLMTPLRRIILDEVRVASKKQPNEFGYKSDESVYIALRLMQAVTARVNAVCLRYLDNSRLDSLPPPPAQRELKTVSCAAKNSRRVMEDRHTEIGHLEALFGIESTERTSFYAVYDGHAGSAAATYCAAHLHQYLVESPHFASDLRRAMRDAFLRTDADFIRKSNQERANGGSTAVAVAVRGSKLLAAWAGDSLALLAKRMRLMQLVRPHKPGRQDERERIEASGGSVIFWGTWRVNGQLAVSRAIGDAQYKPYVTARPEIATVDLDGDEDFVVVACDGLWDFVSEDDVALAVYRQLAADPDDLKAVTKRLIVQAKRQGSADNISIIVVFLKDPRDIAADNCPPMELGLDNALANAPPFAMETEACKRPVEGPAAEVGECAEADAETEPAGNGVDNGLDNSDSDSEDLGPETAVDADDVDADKHEPAPPTPPAHAVVEEGQVDGALVDNVAESGDDSEDEWNYFKGEGEREDQNPSEVQDEPPRSETPCQDNSAWESSSVDMNSSPLNPDAPVFVPGTVAGSDLLLAESPRKPLPMDDIEMPDDAQFQTGAIVRPAELLDLDNCDQLNGHHNVSIDDTVKEHLNGNDKCDMDSLGFGFNVGIEPEKVKDTGFIQDFERIQKDTTDFCNIQVFQSHTETNPFSVDGDDELFERLKNKERDPMSMSFYQEKDDDTCERLPKNTHVDLNAVQPLPDSDDEDGQTNGICEENDKENVNPGHTDIFGIERDIQEPNNDIMRFDDRSTDPLTANNPHFGQGDNFVDYNATNINNLQNYSNLEFETCGVPQDAVLQTDTPESHKLLFEQIPEIPDGKSSELGFANDDMLAPSENEKDISAITPELGAQEIDDENKVEDSQIEAGSLEPIESVESKEFVFSPDSGLPENEQVPTIEQLPVSPVPSEHNTLEVTSPEPVHDVHENIVVDVHEHSEFNHDNLCDDTQTNYDDGDLMETMEPPEIQLDGDRLTPEVAAIEISAAESPLPTESPLPARSPLPTETSFPSESPLPKSPLPSESPMPAQSPALIEASLPRESPLLAESTLPSESPLPAQSPMPREPSLPRESLLLQESSLPSESPLPAQSPALREPSLPRESPLPQESSLPSESPLPAQSPALREPSLPRESPLPQESSLPSESPLPARSPALREPSLPSESPLPQESPLPCEPPQPEESPLPQERLIPSESPLPRESPLMQENILTSESPLPAHSPALREASLPRESPLPQEDLLPPEPPLTAQSPALREPSLPRESPLPNEGLLPSESSLPTGSPLPTENMEPSESPLPSDSHFASEKLASASLLPRESPLPSESPLPRASPLPAEVPLPRESPLPELASGPAPQALALDLQPVETLEAPVESRVHIPVEAELLTSTGLSESRLTPEQNGEIECADEATELMGGPTPDIVPEGRAELVTDIDLPESRAQEICVPVSCEIPADVPPAQAPPAQDAPLAAAPADVAPAVAVAAAAAVATAAVATAAIKSKTPAKKSPTTPTAKLESRTPKSAAKTPVTQKTPSAATPRRTAPTPPAAARPSPAAPRAPAARPAAAAPKPAAPRPAPATRSPAAKPAAAPSRPAARASAASREPATARPAAALTRAAPAPRAAPKPPAPAAPRSVPKTTAAAPKSAAAPAAPKTSAAPAVPKSAPARPAPRPAVTAAAAKPRPKAPEKKPLTNGDVKDAKPAAAKPAPRPAPIRAPTRPAAPRAPAAPAAPPAKSAAPRAAPRAALDKQSKDLANKRITARAAPPRTLTTKSAVRAGGPAKAPPSPAEGALLPDVIA